VLVPFFVGVRRQTYVARYVFPNIYYRTGLGPDQGTSRLFFFPFWESAVKRPGDYMWEALLGPVRLRAHWPQPLPQAAVHPLRAAARPGPPRPPWYGKPPPRRTQERRYGLDTRTW
jgi:hypothetical protein